jgi:hypothetical protein
MARQPVAAVDQGGQPGFAPVRGTYLTHGRPDTRTGHGRDESTDRCGVKNRIRIDADDQLASADTDRRRLSVPLAGIAVERDQVKVPAEGEGGIDLANGVAIGGPVCQPPLRMTT